MRTPFLPLIALQLVSCRSAPVHIAADRCWSVSVDDKVQGPAILYIPSPFTFHVAPKLAGGRDCPRYRFRLANDAVSRVYDEIERTRLSDNDRGGPKERIVVLSGNVIRTEGSSGGIIRITQLRFARTADLKSKQ